MHATAAALVVAVSAARGAVCGSLRAPSKPERPEPAPLSGSQCAFLVEFSTRLLPPTPPSKLSFSPPPPLARGCIAVALSFASSFRPPRARGALAATMSAPSAAAKGVNALVLAALAEQPADDDEIERCPLCVEDLLVSDTSHEFCSACPYQVRRRPRTMAGPPPPSGARRSPAAAGPPRSPPSLLQVCLFCWKYMKDTEGAKAKCPGCRKIYPDQPRVRTEREMCERAPRVVEGCARIRRIHYRRR